MAKLKNKNGFTLIELLVVISIIALLLAIMVPALTKAKLLARAVICRSNVRQLVLANLGYTNDNDGFCVPAAEDFWQSAGFLQGGYHRWHGTRSGNDMPFDSSKGPLMAYFSDGKVKECAQKIYFITDKAANINFESGCGGYGYNMAYIGSRLSFAALDKKSRYAKTARIVEIKKPAQTLMFCDTAFLQDTFLIEYSFAEPPYIVTGGRVWEGFYSTPSIHFRHSGLANIGWSDGHIEPMPMADIKNRSEISFGTTEDCKPAFAALNIAWFEPLDNSLFDLK